MEDECECECECAWALQALEATVAELAEACCEERDTQGDSETAVRRGMVVGVAAAIAVAVAAVVDGECGGREATWRRGCTVVGVGGMMPGLDNGCC